MSKEITAFSFLVGTMAGTVVAAADTENKKLFSAGLKEKSVGLCNSYRMAEKKA